MAWQTARRFSSDESLRAAAGAALRHGGRWGESLSIVVVDEPTLQKLHAEYLDDPSPTDVLSFDLGDDAEGPMGELYVSLDRAEAVAGERGVTPERELALYVVHGTLHLCGYDDHEEQDRARMRAAERAVMDALGYEPDSAPHDA